MFYELVGASFPTRISGLFSCFLCWLTRKCGEAKQQLPSAVSHAPRLPSPATSAASNLNADLCVPSVRPPCKLSRRQLNCFGAKFPGGCGDAFLVDEENDVKPVSEVVPARANLVCGEKKINNAEVCVKNPWSYYEATLRVV